MGGFECATHQRRDRTRIDVIEHTQHDQRCADDYRLLAEAGLHTVRDGLRWHLIETEPGSYDWSSFLPMLDAALSTGTQVIWDLCHWGVPPGLDPLGDDFAPRFARFAAAAAELVRSGADAAGRPAPSLFCPINEISFWAWVGGDEQHFFPYLQKQGPVLKKRLVMAARLAIEAVRQVDPTARFVQAEPIIYISPDPRRPEERASIAQYVAGQFEVWDMLAGKPSPGLAVAEDLLDVIGVNFYWNNEWIDHGDRTPPGHQLHRPLHEMLLELWQRYSRPLMITETGAEGGAAIGWLGYVTAEVRQAMRLGVPVLGVCLYPVMDYPGWDDNRHCRCGLIECSADWTRRSLREDFAAELALQEALFKQQQPTETESPAHTR